MSSHSHFHHKIHSHPDSRPAFPVIDAIRTFPNQFCLGSDLCGHFDSLGKAMAR